VFLPAQKRPFRVQDDLLIATTRRWSIHIEGGRPLKHLDGNCRATTDFALPSSTDRGIMEIVQQRVRPVGRHFVASPRDESEAYASDMRLKLQSRPDKKWNEARQFAYGEENCVDDWIYSGRRFYSGISEFIRQTSSFPAQVSISETCLH
jgi:hypothetical protein